jgi:hypothetical protein
MLKETVWPLSSAGPGEIPVAYGVGELRPRIFIDGLIRTLREGSGSLMVLTVIGEPLSLRVIVIVAEPFASREAMSV